MASIDEETGLEISEFRKLPLQRSRIIGTWELVRYVGINNDDPEDFIYPMGPNAIGQIMYSSDGYMSVVLQCRHIERFDGRWCEGTNEEYGTVGRKTFAYAGPYYLDENTSPFEHQTIVHNIEFAVHPNLIGFSQVRCAEIEEEDGHEYLTLGPTHLVFMQGAKRICKLRWRKRTENTATHPPPELKEHQL